jgi:FtsP/CotA-like multicopper oxidase with cupredoxin domain
MLTTALTETTYMDIISTDGNTINKPSFIKDQLINVAPGERCDIEFKADNPGTCFLESHDKDTLAAKNMVEKIQYDGTNKQTDQGITRAPYHYLILPSMGKQRKANLL